MAESLFSILSDKNFDEPPQLTAVKAYIKRHFDEEVSGKVLNKNIVVHVQSASLAGSLRMHMADIQEQCDLDGRLIIRIVR